MREALERFLRAKKQLAEVKEAMQFSGLVASDGRNDSPEDRLREGSIEFANRQFEAARMDLMKGIEAEGLPSVSFGRADHIRGVDALVAAMQAEADRSGRRQVYQHRDGELVATPRSRTSEAPISSRVPRNLNPMEGM